MMKVMKDIFSKLMYNILKMYVTFTMIYHFCLKECNLKKFKKHVANLHDKKNVIHIRNLKQALNHGLVLKKVHRVIKFNQKDCLKPYIDMNTELRKNEKIILKKIF